MKFMKLRYVPLVGAGIAFFMMADTAPYPSYYKYILEIPMPFHGISHIVKHLRPQTGQKILEIGAGTGRHARKISKYLGDSGKLFASDLQTNFVEHMTASFRKRGIKNIQATQENCENLSFTDQSLDAVYSVTCLGEVNDLPKALSEISRVLKVGGVGVFAEFPDRHYIKLEKLTSLAREAGLELDSYDKNFGIYVSRFKKIS